MNSAGNSEFSAHVKVSTTSKYKSYGQNKLIYYLVFVCLFDLILYVPSTIFQLNRDGSSWVEPVLS